MKGSSMAQNQGVSIVVPHLPNTRKEELARLIRALETQTVQDFELLVVENRKTAFENNNIGWKKACGKIIWFLADDVIPDPDALEQALRVFENRAVDGVEGHMYGKLNRIYELGFMSGHIFYTRRILEQVGGFDERFKGWRGDTDLGWTILERGGSIEYCPDSRVNHPAKGGTAADIKAEMLLKNKHPETYRYAKKNRLLRCLLRPWHSISLPLSVPKNWW